MQIHIRFSGIALLVIVVAGAAGWFVYDRYFPRFFSTVETTIATPEVPVVMRTPGGALEIATVKVYERFTHTDSKVFGSKEWGQISLGDTISQIQVAVTYRYHIEMAKEWPLLISAKTCIVRAGQVNPSFPVAFDTTSMQKQTKSGWARFNKNQNLATLEKSLTPELEKRSHSAQYRQLAIEAGRQTVAEFVTTWLLKEKNWKRDPEYKVIVVFPGEPMPKLTTVPKSVESQQ